MKLTIFALILTASAAIGSDNYLKLYAGLYTVADEAQTDENSTEEFYLDEDGGAIYIWIFHGGEEHQFGKWNATKDSISIIIDAQTGKLKMDFEFVNGRFADAENSNRYLKKKK